MYMINLNDDAIIVETIKIFKTRIEDKKFDLYHHINENTLSKGIRFTLLYLKEALLFNNPTIFVENIKWFLESARFHDFHSFIFYDLLDCLKEAFGTYLNQRDSQKLSEIIEEALQRSAGQMVSKESYFDQPGVEKIYCEKYLNGILTFEKEIAKRVLIEALAEFGSLLYIYKHILCPVQYEIGRLWQSGLASVAQEHFCTSVTRELMSYFFYREKMTEPNEKTFLGMCVKDEHHSIGIKMVCDYFNLNGWKTILLDENNPHEDLVDIIISQNVNVIGISTAMPYNFHTVKKYIDIIKGAEMKNRPLILVGGLAFNCFPDVWRQINADGYTKSAEEAFALANRMITF